MVEGNQAVGQVVATDEDADSSVTYSIKTGPGSADGGLFSIDAVTGEINFSAAPDFENPQAQLLKAIRNSDCIG